MHRPLLPALLLGSAILLPGEPMAQETPRAPAIEAEPAEPGTPTQAAALRAALEAYLTQAPFESGILGIEPDPAGHRILLDPAPLLSQWTRAEVRFAPLSVVVSERGDGNWNVFSDDPLDVAVSFKLDGQVQENEYRQDWQILKGVFSPELGTFLSTESHAGPSTGISRDDFSVTISGISGVSGESRARPTGPGAADIDLRQSYQSYAQSMAVEIPLEEGAEPFGFTVDTSVAEIDAAGQIRAGRTRAMLDLYAAVLSHADVLLEEGAHGLAGEPGVEISQAIRAALPLWNEMEVATTATDVVASTLYGDMTVAESTQTVRLSGIDTSAFFEIGFTMSGIETVSPFIPEWAQSFVPRTVEMGFAISEANLAEPLEIALREARFGEEEPLSPDALAQILEAFDPLRVQARIDGGRIESDVLDILFEGDMSFAQGAPEGRLNIEAGGLDEAIAQLQEAAAQAPELHQGVGMLQIAKGFGRPSGEGRTVWLVEAGADGSVSVNGAMLKAPEGEDEPGSDNL